MVIQERIHKIGWLGERSFAGTDRSFKRTMERRAVAAVEQSGRSQASSLATQNIRWFSYALMVLGAGCIAAAFLQDTQAHPWWPLLLGWAGTMAIIRGILSKGSHNA